MASLQAKSSLRSAHPLFFANKVVSLTGFILLLGAGWIALSYIKNDVFDRWRFASGNDAPVASQKVEDSAVSEMKSLAPTARIVYYCAADRDYYHASTHLPTHCERIVLSEEAALGRGLKRCKHCFPD